MVGTPTLEYRDHVGCKIREFVFKLVHHFFTPPSVALRPRTVGLPPA